MRMCDGVLTSWRVEEGAPFSSAMAHVKMQDFLLPWRWLIDLLSCLASSSADGGSCIAQVWT